MTFAVNIVTLHDSIKGYSAIKNQLLKSGTSIGANIHEANYAQSKADFIAKMQIALKECYETDYWLKLLIASKITENKTIDHLIKENGKIRRLLIASLNTSKSCFLEMLHSSAL